MEMTINLFDLLKFAGPILIGFIGVLFAVMRLLVSQFEKMINTRFSGLEKAMAKGNDEALRIERELAQLKAELPNNYVRRDDYIRNQSTIESKIDGLALVIQNAILKGDRNG